MNEIVDEWIKNWTLQNNQKEAAVRASQRRAQKTNACEIDNRNSAQMYPPCTRDTRVG